MDVSRGRILAMTAAALVAAGAGVMSADEPPAKEPATIHAERWPEVARALAADPELEAAVSEVLGRMTLEEKVGQVIQGQVNDVTPQDVRTYHLGSVLNGGGTHPGGERRTSPMEWVRMADAYWDASMDTSDGGQAIPIIWGSDAVHGHTNVIGATVFPHNVGLGATRDSELVRRIGVATAEEIAVTGLDWDFGPVVGVVRDDRWGRTYESFSEDPGVVAELGAAMVRGLQGEPGSEGFLDASHVIACAKHFMGDGGTAGGTDQGDNLSGEAELRDIHGAGYVSAVGAGVQTVMASFSSWHGHKMHGFAPLLTDVLKDRMGFDGFIVGDWNGHGQLEGCSNGSCPDALNAGLDMYMAPGDWRGLFRNTLAQVRAGEIPLARLDDAVRRILRVKMRAHLFQRGRPSSRPLAGKLDHFGSPEHRGVARQAVRESLVLLKNNGGLLPLAPDQKVLVAGDGADNIGKQCGGWTITWQGAGNGNDDFPGGTSIWDGIREVVENAGGKAVLSPDGSFTAKPDVAVVVWGEDPYAEFQGDRETLSYGADRPQDLALLKRLAAQGIPVVSIFVSGRPMWVNPELNASNAFVAAWLPGTEGGGVADVIFRGDDGAVRDDFRGRLSFSWPRTAVQTPLNRGDAAYDPLFPFGFGLTYADHQDLPKLSEESGVTGTAASRTVYFASGPVAPWKLYLGDSLDLAMEETGPRTTTRYSDNLVMDAVDRAAQGDSRALRWSGAEPARVYLAGQAPVDLGRESNGGLALAVELLLEEAPAGKVSLGMGCVGDCWGWADVTGRVKQLPLGEWATLEVPLRCFEKAGADMTRIIVPFALESTGTLALRLGGAKLVAAPEEAVPCP